MFHTLWTLLFVKTIQLCSAVGKQPQTVCQWVEVNMTVIDRTLLMGTEIWSSDDLHMSPNTLWIFFPAMWKSILSDGLYKNRQWCRIWSVDCRLFTDLWSVVLLFQFFFVLLISSCAIL